MNLKVIFWMKTPIQAIDNPHTNTSHTTKTIIKTTNNKTIMTLLEVEVVVEDILRIIEAATAVDTTTIITTTTKVTDNFCIRNPK